MASGGEAKIVRLAEEIFIKDLAKDVGKTAEKDIAKDIGKDVGKDVGKDAERDAAKDATQAAENKARMQAVHDVGRQGETSAGTTGAKARIPSNSRPGRFRIPDRMTPTVLTEVKNVARLDYRSQLKDFLHYAENAPEGKRVFEIVVRRGTGTKIAPKLLELEKEGRVVFRRIL